MQIVGPDRWPGFIADAQARAGNSSTVAAVSNSQRGFEYKHDAIQPVYPIETMLGIGAAATAGGAAAALRITGSAILRHILPGRDATPDGLSTEGSSAHPVTNDASTVRGLPPAGEDAPPVRNPGGLESRPASRPSEAAIGGRSLWDEDGGEWRYYPEDKRHNPHWDYNDHRMPNSEWQNIPSAISCRESEEMRSYLPFIAQTPGLYGGVGFVISCNDQTLRWLLRGLQDSHAGGYFIIGNGQPITSDGRCIVMIQVGKSNSRPDSSESCKIDHRWNISTETAAYFRGLIERMLVLMVPVISTLKM